MVGLMLAMLLGAAAPAARSAGVACGPTRVATISSVDGGVATKIYLGELSGNETKMDLLHITGAPDLLAAVVADDRRATLTAVERIVYHPRWHIVRLRVLDAAGRVLADFGGPYVIAPVTGILRSASGAAVGSFVMSVQDDLGFAKLEYRFVGDPIGVYVNRKLVVERAGSFPRQLPAGVSLKLGGVSYNEVLRTFNAFPNGTLTAVIAVPMPLTTLPVESCTAVVVGEIARVAQRIAALYAPLAANYPAFVEVITSDTGAIVVVRLGLRTIAASEGPGPPTLPESGPVVYLSQSWTVFSFAPTPPARIYVLIPAASPG